MNPVSATPKRVSSRHLIGALLLVFAAMAMAVLPTTANASPAAVPAASSVTAPPATPVGNYSGHASADLVHASVLSGLPVGSVADAQVIPAVAAVDSTATPQSTATASNAHLQVASSSIPVQSATQTAAPDNPNHLIQQLAALPITPVANVSAVTADVNARWAGANQCVAVGTPISTADAQVASVDLLQLLPGTTPILSLNNQAGGTIETHSTVGLVNVPGQTTQGVQSQAITQLTGLTLAGGLTINVVAPLQLTAVAGGTPGSAKITATQPIVQIKNGSTIVATLDATHTSFALPSNPLINLSLGTVVKNANVNGQSASASGSLLSLSLLALPGGPTVASAALGESSVDATAPAGGVKCPPPFNPLNEVHKDASSSVVAPGGTFNYTVTVPNRGNVPISSLVVTDTITGPAGFTVTNTAPTGSVSGNTITWHDATPLQPNETRNYTITVQVPASAAIGATFSDTATATGVYNGQTVTQTVTLPNIPRVGTPPFNGCHLSDSNKAADHLEVQPGETFNYYVHVLNDGNQPCSGVTVTDNLDSRVTYVSSTNGGTASGQTVTWNVGTVAPGSSLTLTVTVKVNANATGSIPNTALIHQPGQGDITLHTAGPQITNNSILAPANPPGFGGAGVTKMAFTGWNQPLWLVSLLLGAAAILSLGLARYRRQD